MKCAQKNFEHHPTNFFFRVSETLCQRKQKITNEVRDLIMHLNMIALKTCVIRLAADVNMRVVSVRVIFSYHNDTKTSNIKKFNTVP